MRIQDTDETSIAPAALPTPYNSNRTTPEDFGAGIAQGVGAVERAASNVYEQDRRRARTDLLASMDANLGHAINDAEWNPGDPKTGDGRGFMLQLGQNAIDSAPHIRKLDKVASDLGNQLRDDPEAESIFRQRAFVRLEEARRRAEAHSGEQIRAVGQQVAEGQQKLAFDSIGLLHGTPDEVTKGTDHYVGLATGPMLHHLADNEGMPDVDVQAHLKDFTSAAYGKALQGFLDSGDGLGAKEFYDKNVERLGASAPEYEKRVRSVATTQQAGLVAHDIMQKATVQGGLVDEGKAYELWDALPEDAVKHAAQEALSSRITLHNKGVQQAEQQTLGRVFQDIEHHGGQLNESTDDFARLTDWGKAQALEKSRGILRQQGIESRRAGAEDRRADIEARREQAQANREAVNGFNALPIEQQVQVDPATLYPGADKATSLYIQGLQKKSAVELQKGQAPQRGEFDQVVKAAARQLNLTKEVAADLNSHMTDWRYQYLDEHKGQAPSRQDVNAELAKALTYGKTGLFWGRRYEFQAEKAGVAGDFKPDEPADQKFPPNRGTPDAGSPAPLPLPAGAATAQRNGTTGEASFLGSNGNVMPARTANGETRYWNGSAWVGTVRMRSPSGKVFQVPADKAAEAISHKWEKL